MSRQKNAAAEWPLHESPNRLELALQNFGPPSYCNPTGAACSRTAS